MQLETQVSAENYLERIESLESLKPSKQTNKVLSALVEDIIEGKISENELEPGEIKRMRKLCGKAEFKLEEHWAEKIVDSESPEERIRDFPYYNNYLKLADFEYSVLVGCCNDLKKKAVFVGGGPLPMTAIIFAKNYGLNVSVIDRDTEAVERSEKLLNSLNVEAEVIEASAETFMEYDSYDAVHIASMVGENREEESEVFQNINSQLGEQTHIIGRTVHGNRKLLYRPVSDSVKKMFNVEAEKKPSKDIVNSTTVMTLH